MASKNRNVDKQATADISHLAALRRDWPTGLSIYLVFLATICVATSLNGLVGTTGPYPYEEPVFWGMVIVFMSWLWSLRLYSSLPIASYRIMKILDIPIAVLIMVVAYYKHADGLGFFIGAAILTTILIAASAWYYRKSVLHKLGPVR